MKNVPFHRQNHTRSSPDIAEDEAEHPAIEPNRTKEELLALVDQYSGESYTDQLPLLEPPNLYQPSDGPHLMFLTKWRTSGPLRTMRGLPEGD